MWNGLEKLLELQDLDTAVARLEVEVRAIPEQIKVLESRLAGSRSELDAARAKAEQVHKERRAKERELDDVTLNIKKKQARLFEIKTNQEYSAVLREIEVLKERSSKLEEEILELMERADVAAKTLAEADQAFKAADSTIQKDRAEKEAQLATFQKDLAHQREARKAQASRLDRGLLQQYARLVRSREVAVVAVKDGSCTGCGMVLTPQTYTEVRRNDRMFTCTSCNRILYYAG
jgi:predicted  nucleic acid-binding Zn-ribbon protein